MELNAPGEFERLYAAALPAARRFALRLTRNPDDAEDLLQESAIRAWKAFGQHRRDRSFKSWFLTIISHLHIDRNRLIKAQSLDAYLDTRVEERHFTPLFVRTDADPETCLMQRESEEAARRLVASLPSPFREAVQARYMDNLDYKECVRFLGCPGGTVATRLMRGRQLLRERHDSGPLARPHAR